MANNKNWTQLINRNTKANSVIGLIGSLSNNSRTILKPYGIIIIPNIKDEWYNKNKG
jgi:hypothetical protein